MNKAAVYVRCSTAQQNLEVQLNDLSRYAKARDLDVVEIFQDHGVSGAKDKRPALDRMMKMARQKKFKYVLAWRLDRLGRNTRHLLTLLDEFESLQISFVSYSEGFDLTTPLGRVIATVMASLATFERELTRERVIAGIQNARSKGKRLGRPPKADATAIRKYRQQGLTVREVASKVGVSHATVVNVLNKI